MKPFGCLAAGSIDSSCGSVLCVELIVDGYRVFLSGIIPVVDEVFLQCCCCVEMDEEGKAQTHDLYLPLL